MMKRTGTPRGLKGKVAAATGLTLALAFGAVPAFAADHTVDGNSPQDVPMPLVGTVKAPPEVISVSMPSSITWAFALDAGGNSGTAQAPANQRITNLDAHAKVNAKITSVTDADNLLQKMSITLNGNTLIAATGLNLDLGTAAPSGTEGDSIPLTLDAFIDHGPVAPGDYRVVPTITLTRQAVA